MNKVSMASLIACMLVAPSAMATGIGGQNDESRGIITFTGLVFSNSCAISSEDKNQTISLAPVMNKLINSVTAVKTKEFTIKVRDCYVDDNIKPKLYWTNTGELSSEGYMIDNTKGSASNAALVLMKSNNEHIDLNKSNIGFDPESYSRSENGNHKGLTYRFKVGYIKSKDVSANYVTPGPIQTQLSYMITYI